MAAVTDLADATAAGTAGYATTRYTVTSQQTRTYVTKLSKYITPPVGSTFEFMGLGASTVDQATADANALAALNANRRHRYALAPGRASGSADAQPDLHGDTHVVDVS